MTTKARLKDLATQLAAEPAKAAPAASAAPEAPAAPTMPPSTAAQVLPEPPATAQNFTGLLLGVACIGVILGISTLDNSRAPAMPSKPTASPVPPKVAVSPPEQAAPPAVKEPAAPALPMVAAPELPILKPALPAAEPARAESVTEAPRATSYTNAQGLEFVKVPKGCFQMGQDPALAAAGVSDHGAEHRVCLTRDYFLGKTEVTQSQWSALMEQNPSKFQGPDLPVEEVSWTQVQTFIQRLNQRENGEHYRLPTEAEWEYAARAGTASRYSFGDHADQARQYAWFVDNSGEHTHPVGKLQPNPWGLHDMHGNVFEWVQDWFDRDYYRTSPADDPRGPDSGKERVIRGGSWNAGPALLKSSSRFGVAPDLKGGGLGFRLVWQP